MLTTCCQSPLGPILLACDETGITGLWFAGQARYASNLPPDSRQGDSPFFAQAKQWLELYFSGRDPGFLPPLHLLGTAYQVGIWEQLLAIPYGQTRTYGSLGAPRAVGSAVGRNPISLMVPCHRVVGKTGSLRGYAGGLNRKTALLKLEGIL